MHAEALRHRGEDEDLAMPVLMALALHAGVVALLIIAGWWQPLPKTVSVAGPVVEAALVISDADVAQALDAAEAAPPPEPVEAAPLPQPIPEPIPQDSPDETQPVPQEVIPEPDTVDQDAVARLAEQAAEERQRELQEERRIQEQIDLTEEREKQAEAERRQRRREQLEAIRQERAEAERRRILEEQRLQQIADAQAARRQPEPSPDDRPAVQSGNTGTDTDLLARYALAMHQTADASWNRSLAPEGVPCKVRFTQIPGGEVIDVQFLSCPFSGTARESVERALRRGHMPYDGFESVFERTVDLTFCYPEEACPR
jgi:colicin import membrane protein